MHDRIWIHAWLVNDHWVHCHSTVALQACRCHISPLKSIGLIDSSASPRSRHDSFRGWGFDDFWLLTIFRVPGIYTRRNVQMTPISLISTTYNLGLLAGEITLPGMDSLSVVIHTCVSLGIGGRSFARCLESKFFFCFVLYSSSLSLYGHALRYEHLVCLRDWGP